MERLIHYTTLRHPCFTDVVLDEIKRRGGVTPENIGAALTVANDMLENDTSWRLSDEDFEFLLLYKQAGPKSREEVPSYVARGPYLLHLAHVEQLVGLKKTTIYRLMKEGQFPRAMKLSGCSRWSAAEIEEWVQARIAERDA
jgi:prophage regulatory protein